MKYKIGMRTLKTAIGATLAIFLAQALGLKYALSAGIITILSVQNTKRKSLEIARLRVMSTVIALFISSVLFTLLGFHPLAFGVYLLIFIPIATELKLSDGIVVSSVLVTHLLGEGELSLSLLGNELLLMVIGAGIALVFNLYMPKMMGQIKADQEAIEQQFKKVLLCLANTTRHQSVGIEEEGLFSTLAHQLEAARTRALLNQENYLFEEMTYYAQYMEMRQLQYQVLCGMRQNLGSLCMTLEQSIMIADLTEHIADSLHECNTADDLIAETEKLLATCREQALPKTRAEFESRALLFQYLNDMLHLLEIKRQFIINLTDKQREMFQIPREE